VQTLWLKAIPVLTGLFVPYFLLSNKSTFQWFRRFVGPLTACRF
jgi:hypothetical protein